jgi:4-hydroxy-tetrahydrodipicolinate synthase
MTTIALHGSMVALVTPFDAALTVDERDWLALIDWQIASGTSALIVAGTTGESPQLSDEEFERLLTLAVARCARRVPVIAGTGSASFERTRALTAKAHALGADAALVVTPYYVRPTQEGLYRHYAALAESSALPIVLYNVPSRTGVDLLPETVARLAAIPQIIGIKEAKADLARIDALLALRPHPRWAVLSGDDETAAAAVARGADGVISVIANALPQAFAELMALAAANDSEWHERQKSLAPLLKLLGAEPNPVPIKWALSALGRCRASVRLPLVPLSPIHHAPLRAALDAAAALSAA